MDAATQQARLDCLAWGLLESPGGRLAWSRRFRGAVMRAAAGLAELEKAGRRPEGGTLLNAVRVALETTPLPPDAKPGEDHEALLVAVELAALPEGVRKLLG